MVTTMFQSLIGCVVILLYLCMGVYIGLGWVKNLCDNTEIKNYRLPIIMFIALMLMFFGCLYTSSYLSSNSLCSLSAERN